MLKNAVELDENSIKKYGDEYNKKLTYLQNICSNYLKNNNDKNFFEIGELLKRTRYNQIVFPKNIRNEKTIKGIEKASLSFYNIEKKLKAFNTIDVEISKNKKTENDQTKTENFDIFLKLNKQSLTSKANKIIYDINSMQLPTFDESLNHISLENRIKKLNKKIDKLKTNVEKKIKILSSNGKVDDLDTPKKIKRIQNDIEKLQAFLEITTSNNKGKDGNNKSDQHIKNLISFANDLEKVQDLLNNIDNSNNVLKILKQGDNENYVVDIANKINKELQSKQNQVIETYKSFTHVPHKSL
jgi:hypothetical protein